MDVVRKYTKVILNIVIPGFGILLVCWLGPKLLRFFMPFVIGWVIAMIANPLVRVLERRVRIVRRHSSMIIVIGVLAAVIALLYFIVSKLVRQAAGLAEDLPVYYEMAVRELQSVSVRYNHIFQMLPGSFQSFWIDFTNNVGAYVNLLVQKIASPTVEAAGNMAKGIPNAFIYVIITIFSSYFFIAERDRILEFWKRYIPQAVSGYGVHLKKDVKHLIGGYFLAQLRIMGVVAVMLLVGFLVLGVRYSFLLALLIAFLDFLPVFGTGTVLIPWAALEIFSGNYPFAAGLALLYLLTQAVRQIIQPKIVGDSMGLPPLMTLLFLFLGFKFGGLSGMILAVPAGIFVMNLYKYGIFDSLIANVKILVHDIDEFRKSED